jgi:malonate decarboxylase gamma subunit
MTLEAVLKILFNETYSIEYHDDFFWGQATLKDKNITIMGTVNGAPIGVQLLLAQSQVILETIKNHPQQPIVFIIDTKGPKLRHQDELLGLNRYMAHMAKCLDLARQKGHPILGIVYGQAVSGGFISSGLFADQCFAFSDTMISVMNLPAMARIMKTPLKKLVELSKSNPVFAPGPENYYKMGAIHDLWEATKSTNLSTTLYQLLEEKTQVEDSRAELGYERGGRKLARLIIQSIIHL